MIMCAEDILGCIMTNLGYPQEAMNLLICLNWERMKKYTLNAHDIVALPFPPWSQQRVPMQIHSSLKTHIFPGNIPSKGARKASVPRSSPQPQIPASHTPHGIPGLSVFNALPLTWEARSAFPHKADFVYPLYASHLPSSPC